LPFFNSIISSRKPLIIHQVRHVTVQSTYVLNIRSLILTESTNQFSPPIPLEFFLGSINFWIFLTLNWIQLTFDNLTKNFKNSLINCIKQNKKELHSLNILPVLLLDSSYFITKNSMNAPLLRQHTLSVASVPKSTQIY